MASTSKTLVADIKTIGDSISKEILKDGIPCPDRCTDLITSLASICAENKITISILEETMIGKSLTKANKSFKRQKRTSDATEADKWQNCISQSDKILLTLKEQVSNEHNEKKAAKTAAAKRMSLEPGLPKNATVYKSRLESQKKEMYKNPPVLPPPTIPIEDEFVALPKRDKKTGEFTFTVGEGENISDVLKSFHPNRSPEEILRAGAFGGTYFRSIASAVTNIKYKPSDVLRDTLKPEWIKGLNASKVLTSSTYVPSVNKFRVKCGGSLGMWESSGWISDSDPYGWFQWYCRFYQGRRCGDDGRQISRWMKSVGEKGRFRSQLCNKIFAAGGFSHVSDVKISPVIRQTLLHWGLEITEDILRKHGKRVGKL